jgi:hypothetical protein
MKELFSFETSETDYPATGRNTPDEQNPRPRRRKNFKTRKLTAAQRVNTFLALY